MAAFFRYASFPNSRIKPRPSTTAAFTNQVTITNLVTSPFVRVVAADLNRTYMLLENFSSSVAFFYVYASASAINPSVVATFGVTGQMILFTGANQLYQKTDDGTNTHWSAVAIEDVGEKVLPLQVASLDSPQAVYAAAETGSLVVGIDKGVG